MASKFSTSSGTSSAIKNTRMSSAGCGAEHVAESHVCCCPELLLLHGSTSMQNRPQTAQDGLEVQRQQGSASYDAIMSYDGDSLGYPPQACNSAIEQTLHPKSPSPACGVTGLAVLSLQSHFIEYPNSF